MKNKVYMAVTADEYELPIALFENIHEMCAFNKRTQRHNHAAMTRGNEDKKTNVDM